MTPRAAITLLLASAVLAGVACDDTGPTRPVAAPGVDHPITQYAARSVVSKSTTVEAVRVLKRTASLDADLVTSGVIGPDGGTLSIPQAGIRVEFSRGAVSSLTLITVTATAGDAVAYQFEPHGLKFSAPVTVRQSLQRTDAWKNPPLAHALQGSYFEGTLAANFVDARGAYARIKEARKAKLESDDRYLDFAIEHFSGYMVSTGFAPVDVSIGIEP